MQAIHLSQGRQVDFFSGEVSTDITRLGRFRICTHHGYYDVLRIACTGRVAHISYQRGESCQRNHVVRHARSTNNSVVNLVACRHTASSAKTGFLCLKSTCSFLCATAERDILLPEKLLTIFSNTTAKWPIVSCVYLININAAVYNNTQNALRQRQFDTERQGSMVEIQYIECLLCMRRIYSKPTQGDIMYGVTPPPPRGPHHTTLVVWLLTLSH